MNGGVCDSFQAYIWEPALVKLNAIGSATEAACLILSIDETVRNPRSEGANNMAPSGMGRGMAGRGRGGGMPMGRGRGELS